MMGKPDEDEADAALFAERMAELTAGQGEGAASDAAMQRTTPWDIQDHIGTETQQIAYLEAAFEDGDPLVIAAAISDIARARGMSKVAQEAGVTREALYKALSAKGDPRLSTLLGVMRALGITLVPKWTERETAA